MTARYSICPADAFEDERLTPSDLRILGILGAFLNKANEAWPSQGTLAKKAKVDRKTANRALQKLVAFGYVKATARPGAKMKTTLLYEVVLSASARIDAAILQPDLFANEAQGGSKTSTTTDGELFPMVEKSSTTADGEFRPDGTSGCPTNIPKTPIPNGIASEAEIEDEAEIPVSEHPAQLQKRLIFGVGTALLRSQKMPEAKARAYLGGLIKSSSISIVAQVVSAAAIDPPIDARGWLRAAVIRRASQAGIAKPQTAETRADAETDRIAELDRRMAVIAAGGSWGNKWGMDPRVGDDDIPPALYEKHGIPRPGTRPKRSVQPHSETIQ